MAPVVLAPYALDLTPGVDRALIGIGYVLWAVFAVHVALQLLLNPDRVAWLSRHWLDVVVAVVPMSRPFHAARTLRMWWAIAAGARGLLGMRRLLSNRRMAYVLGTAVIAVSISADLVLEAEKASPGASIHTFGDALWWAVTTVTSVGYGDKYPTTPTGRGIGIALMVLGIALFGVVTASLAGLLIEAEENRLERQLDDVDARLRRIEAALGKQSGRQRAIADRAMRMAKRTRIRTRKDKDKERDVPDRPGKEKDRQPRDPGRHHRERDRAAGEVTAARTPTAPARPLARERRVPRTPGLPADAPDLASQRGAGPADASSPSPERPDAAPVA